MVLATKVLAEMHAVSGSDVYARQGRAEQGETGAGAGAGAL